MPEECLHYSSISAVAHALRTRSLTSETLCRQLLARISTLDPRLNSYISVLAGSALSEARRADLELERGIDRGPLQGVPLAVKDLLFAVEGPTTGGTAIHREHRAGFDATAVRRLRAAGAVLLGKLAMTEAGGMMHHPHYADPINPYNERLWTGVSSSGGGVATAAGLCFGSLGSDTGGSIRFPSACNGLTGLRPTWGRVSRHGVLHLAQSYDTIGPMCRSAADAAHLLAAIAGGDDEDPTCLRMPAPDYAAELRSIAGARGLRVGIDWSYVSDGASETTVTMMRHVVEVLSSLGAHLIEVDLPDTREFCLRVTDLHMAELALSHSASFPEKATQYGDWLRRGIERGRAQKSADLAGAAIARDKFKGQLARIFLGADIILLPVFARGTPTRAEAEWLTENEPQTLFRFTIPSAAAGLPSLTLPAPMSEGVPAGFQMVGRACEEHVLLRAGHALQLATGWHLERPAIA